MDKKTIAIIVLAVIILLGSTLFAVGSIVNKSTMNGMQIGFDQAIVAVAQSVATCQVTPLQVGNQTINIVATECLKQAQE